MITGDAGDNVLVGTVGADTISGLGGADTLTGGDGADTLDGGDGSDTLDGGLGNDTLIGGAGDDVLVDNYGQNSFDGGDGNDTITTNSATAGQVIRGGAGNDNITAQILGVGSVVYGGSGNDYASIGYDYYVYDINGITIDLGDGTNKVITTAHDSNILMGSGDDLVYIWGILDNFKTGKNNNIDLGGGNNYIIGYNGNDYTWVIRKCVIAAGIGNDAAYVWDGNTLNLGDGNNTVTANSGNTIITGAGGDVFTLGSTNTVTGGAGVDTYKLAATSLGNVITDFTAGAGGDIIDATYLLQTVPSYPGGNPFGTGNLRIVQDGADAKLQVDLDGPGTTSDFVTVATLTNVKSSAINTHNFASMYLVGTEGDDKLDGGLGVDTLDGKAGNDTLDGGWGGDTMSGGTGNDTYKVDDTGDKAIEVSGTGSGTDTVLSSVNYTLGANVENLVLETGATAGTGNGVDNVITGNDADNTLSGGLGNDTLNGVLGNDALNGGTGTDIMAGGTGNDLYYVDAAGDQVTEAVGDGTDRVSASVTYSLSTNVENLTLSGSTAIDGTGNTDNNVLTGNSGSNTLSGLDGNDVLNGGAGTDTLIGGTGSIMLAAFIEPDHGLGHVNGARQLDLESRVFHRKYPLFSGI